MEIYVLLLVIVRDKNFRKFTVETVKTAMKVEMKSVRMSAAVNKRLEI